jgi:hypothetical protein
LFTGGSHILSPICSYLVCTHTALSQTRWPVTVVATIARSGGVKQRPLNCVPGQLVRDRPLYRCPAVISSKPRSRMSLAAGSTTWRTGIRRCDRTRPGRGRGLANPSQARKRRGRERRSSRPVLHIKVESSSPGNRFRRVRRREPCLRSSNAPDRPINSSGYKLAKARPVAVSGSQWCCYDKHPDTIYSTR